MSNHLVDKEEIENIDQTYEYSGTVTNTASSLTNDNNLANYYYRNNNRLILNKYDEEDETYVENDQAFNNNYVNEENFKTVINNLNITNASNENNINNGSSNGITSISYMNSNNNLDNKNYKYSNTTSIVKHTVTSKFNSSPNPYGDNLLSNTLNQLNKEHTICNKSYFDNLPPEIEISVYGSETLPENSILEADNTVNTSGAETDTACTASNLNYCNNLQHISIKNKKNLKLRYFD